jgi:deazaflavin-dependent oxidoreductase (nitroreductase family)
VTQDQQAGKKKVKTPGAFSVWMQKKMNTRMNRKIRKGRDKFMGMDVLILHTVGKKSGQARETPVAWFTDSQDSRVLIGSGGGDRHPAWYTNLVAHPEQAKMELPASDAVSVTPHTLDGADREQAWKVIAEAQPRIAKYQSKSEREYPIVRLTPR